MSIIPQTVLALRGSYLLFSELPLSAASDGRCQPVVVVVVAWVPMLFAALGSYAFRLGSYAVVALGSYAFAWVPMHCLLCWLALLACFACLACLLGLLALLACLACLLGLLALLSCFACLLCLLCLLALLACFAFRMYVGPRSLTSFFPYTAQGSGNNPPQLQCSGAAGRM